MTKLNHQDPYKERDPAKVQSYGRQIGRDKQKCEPVPPRSEEMIICDLIECERRIYEKFDEIKIIKDRAHHKKGWGKRSDFIEMEFRLKNVEALTNSAANLVKEFISISDSPRPIYLIYKNFPIIYSRVKAEMGF